MDATEESSPQEQLDKIARNITSQKRNLESFIKSQKKKKLPDDVREIYEQSAGYSQNRLTRLEEEMAQLEPAALVRPSQRFIGLLSKLLPPLPTGVVMGRERRATEAGSSRLHSTALKMAALSIVIAVAFTFVTRNSIRGVYNLIYSFLDSQQVGTWVFILLSIGITSSFSYWRRSVLKQEGAYYQGYYMFLVQWLYTGSKKWSRGQRAKAHLVFVLWYSFIAVFFAPIVFILGLIASIQLMAFYQHELEATNNAVTAAQATATVYRSYEIGMVGALLLVYISIFLFDIFM